MRRLLPLLVAVCLLVPLCLMPLSAAEPQGYFTFQTELYSHDDDRYWMSDADVSYPRSGLTGIIGPYSPSSSRRSPIMDFSVVEVASGTLPVPVSGAIGVYFSIFYGAYRDNLELFESAEWSVVGDGFAASTWDVSYRDQDGLSQPISDVETSMFVPGFDGPCTSPGYSVAAHVELSDPDVALSFTFDRASSRTANLLRFDGDGYVVVDWGLYVPSISIVATESSADLAALEGIADQLSQQNEMLQQYYGDIMSILNAINNECGSIDTTLQLANTYLLQIVNYLSTINSNVANVNTLLSTYLHYLRDIAETSEDILVELEAFHSDFLTKLELLISTVSQESDDIQAKMDEIYEQLIQWLDTQFSQAVDDDFQANNDDVQQGVTDSEAIEQQWTGSLSDAWADTGISDFAFDSSLTSAFMWVSSYWSQLYNALGVYGAVVLIGPILGTSMYILGLFRSGRLGRHGGD